MYAYIVSQSSFCSVSHITGFYNKVSEQGNTDTLLSWSMTWHHHHTYITPTSISQIQQLTLTGPAQGKGGVQSQDSHAMVQEYFVFVFCMSSIYHVIRFWPFLESSLLNMTHNVGQLLVMIIYYKIKDMTLHFKCHKRLTCSSDTSYSKF